MLPRYRGKLALKDWALDIGRRSTMRKARIALARRLAIIMHAMLRRGAEFKAHRTIVGNRNELRSGALPWEGAGDGADSVACG
jgi:hypothetical protein